MLKRIEDVEIRIKGIEYQHTRHQDELLLLHRDYQNEFRTMHKENIAASRKHAQQLSRIEERFAAQEKTSGGLTAMMRNTYSAILELKNMLGQCIQVVIHLQYLASDHMYLRGLDPTRNKPVWLEDALGNLRVIPLEWNPDWKASTSIQDNEV